MRAKDGNHRAQNGEKSAGGGIFSPKDGKVHPQGEMVTPQQGKALPYGRERVTSQQGKMLPQEGKIPLQGEKMAPQQPQEGKVPLQGEKMAPQQGKLQPQGERMPASESGASLRGGKGDAVDRKEVVLSLDLQPQLAPLTPFTPFGAAPVAAPAPTAGSVAQTLDQLLPKMVDQVLINEAALNNKQEVHIHLRDSVLAGSQIQISRDGGELRVAFLTPNAQTADLVQQQQHTLRESLMERLKLEQVTIQTESRQSAGSGGEGRSRGQRDAGEEMRRREEEEAN
jgi:type III secretion system needle length determinant